MAPPTSTEKQKLLMQAEIARLQGQIASSKNIGHANSYHPYSSNRGGYTRGGFRSKPRGRGRGRGGGSYNVDFRGGASTNAAASSSVAPSSEREEGEVTPPPPEPKKTATGSGEGWVKSSRRGNMSLMTVEKRNHLSSLPPPARHPRVPPQVQVLQSTSQSTPGGSESKRVVIDGVIFQFEDGGKKLTRIGELPSSSSSSAPQGTPTRHRLKYGGESYHRTKTGNLVSRATLNAKRAEQAKKPCRYFTKTGRCNLALTCRYQHIPDRVSVCPKFISRSGCNLGDSCPLSHTPSAHNTPSCINFQASATCYHDKCPYPHVRVAQDAPVCEQFAREGWCDREAGTCPELHVWECPEFHAKGTCSRQPRCGLPHVVHGEKLRQAAAAAAAATAPKEAATGSFEDQADFIGLPGEVFSETESEEEDSSDEGGDDDDEEESNDEDEAMEQVEHKGKARESSAGMDTDEDDEARVMEDL